jgi:ubiquinone/menaquinone biosynthesis C-methylase UbiE
MGSLKKSISPWLEEILACPVCKSDVELGGGNALECTNSSCRLEFPVVDGVPIMLAKLSQHHEYEKHFFDQEFTHYYKYELENWRISYIRRILDSLGLTCSADNYYLDVGVGGSGYTVIEAARRGCKSVGLDVSIEGIEKAQCFARLELGEKSDQCGFVVGMAENLPFKKQVFSKLSSVAVLEHVPEDKQAIAEIARVIKPSGKIFLTVPNDYKRIPPIFWLPYHIWDKKIGHLRHYKAENLVTEFLHHGVLTTKVLYSGHLVKVLQNILSRIFPSFNERFSKGWWKLEEMALRNASPTGLQLTLLMRRR